MQRAARVLGTLKLSPEIDDIDRRVRSAWKAAAGKRVEAHTRAVALVRGALIVEVEDQVWQRQLNSLRHFLICNLAKTLGEGIVTEIDFRPMPRRRPAGVATHATGIEDPVMHLLYERSVQLNDRRRSG